MANTFQQKAQVRKLIYAALILALFTVSLIHRILPRYGLDDQAVRLQLRESARGEVNLTSSAVRQVLIGSRAIAVTMLWRAAIDAQDKQNWSEVQLMVDSITTLQPYFITPWRYQGWNLAFNVSGQCDRPADRYYYIAHGLALLAEGERRNQGAEIAGTTRFPGNPDLRQDIGHFYHMKMGISDDKHVMRCLLDLSCIDPVERNFDDLQGDEHAEERREKLRAFCHNYPMLVRRLIEHVHCDDPVQRDGYKIFRFLKENEDVPSRFEQSAPGQKTSVLKKDPNAQFPILPRPEADWPDPNRVALTNEPINPYLMSRTWYQYAQKPLAPPRNFVDITKPEFPEDMDPSQYQRPRMDPYYFRTDPCRAQEFQAELFEQEGWFDGEGWNAAKFLRLEPAGSNKPVVVGDEPKYQVKRVWNRAADMFLETGAACGMYFPDSLRRKFERQAAKYREKYFIRPDQPAPEIKDKTSEDYTNRFAHEALRIQHASHGTTNFDGHLYACRAKGTNEAVLASKYFYNAEWLRGSTAPIEAIKQFELAQPIWLYVLLQEPRYARVATVQEDTYDAQLKYCSLVQGVKYRLFQDVLLGMTELAPNWTGVPLPWSSIPSRQFLSEGERRRLYAGLAPKTADVALGLLNLAPSWPFLPVPWTSTMPARPAWSLAVKSRRTEPGEKPLYRPLLSDTDRGRVMGPHRDSKIRTTRAIFDMMQYYEGPENAPQDYVHDLKDALVCLTYGVSVSPRVPFPYEPALMLTRAPLGKPPQAKDWRSVIESTSVANVRSRLQIKTPRD